ncbi:NAD(+) diphosphatase [Microbacterium sp. MC2]
MTPTPASPLPALARDGIDRAAGERSTPRLVERLRADPATRVLCVHGDRAPLLADGRLHTVAPGDVAGHAEWGFLGRTPEGDGVLVAACDVLADPPIAAERWEALRAVGGDLAPVEAGLFVEALCLGRWLREAPFCPGCGQRLQVRNAGWSRTCEVCVAEHFPRTDPAVIVAITSADGERLLLGQNALWVDRNMFSAFAGFVEAGESLESALVRELLEEAGVEVTDLRYQSSQSWPYPRSLMLGFYATARDEDAVRPDGEEIVATRWFTRAEIAAGLRGEADFRLPAASSIAHTLIRNWLDA